MFPRTAKKKIIMIYNPPFLCSALTEHGYEKNAENAPALFFRVASLANLVIRPIGACTEYSFEWRIDEPVWLPARKKSV
jgi:hypothetical protein